MPFDGSGNFSRLYSWTSDRDNGINILASRMDAEFDNFAAGMNQVFFRNGLVPLSGNLNMGTNYITGLGAGSVGALPIRFADDPNSGFFLNGYNKPTMVAGGTARLEANTAGIAVTGTSTLNGNTAVTGTLSATSAITQAGNQVWHAGNLTPGDYAPLAGAVFTGAVDMRSNATFFGPNAASPGNGANLRLRDDTGTPRWLLGLPGTGGATAFNIFDIVNGTVPLSITSAGTPAGTFTGTYNVTGALTQAGNQVWHAGNFIPANYAPLAGATFTGAVTVNNELTLTEGNYLRLSANPFARASSVTNFIIAASGGLAFRNPGDTSNIAYMGNDGTFDTVGALSQNGNQVWHAGNFNPANYAALSGATFTGNVNAQRFSLDANAYFQIPVADPLLVMDGGGDYYGYSRSGNRHVFAINSTDYLTIGTGGATVNGEITKSGAGNFLRHGGAGLSGNVSRGTAAPSGGSDGDIYLQYS